MTRNQGNLLILENQSSDGAGGRPHRPGENRSERERGIVAVGPLAHGGVVVLGLVVAHQLQDEHSVRRTDAALSIGVDVLVGRDAVV